MIDSDRPRASFPTGILIAGLTLAILAATLGTTELLLRRPFSVAERKLDDLVHRFCADPGLLRPAGTYACYQLFANEDWPRHTAWSVRWNPQSPVEAPTRHPKLLWLEIEVHQDRRIFPGRPKIRLRCAGMPEPEVQARLQMLFQERGLEYEMLFPED